jgi:hypothetical protein
MMERNVLDRSVGEVIAFVAFRTAFATATGIVFMQAPWFIGWPAMGFFAGWVISSLRSLRSGRCQYCGARDGLPLRRNSGPAAPRLRAWYDLRPDLPPGVTWVCGRHFQTYLAERL